MDCAILLYRLLIGHRKKKSNFAGFSETDSQKIFMANFAEKKANFVGIFWANFARNQTILG